MMKLEISRPPSVLSWTFLCATLALTGFECDAFERFVSITSSSAEDTITSAQSVMLEVVAAERIDVDHIELYDRRVMVGQTTDSSYAYEWTVDHDSNGMHRWQAFVWDRSGNLWPTEAITHHVDIAPTRSLAPPTPSSGAEAVCSALGDACTCSEPLNTTEYDVVNVERVNPADTDVKECGFQGSAWVEARTGDAHLEIVPATGMPAQSTVSYVWRNTSTSSIPMMVEGVTSIGDDVRRMCIRQYFRFSADYEGFAENACTSNKVMELEHGGARIQMSDGRGGGNIGIRVDGYNGNGGEWMRESGNVGVADCRGTWCVSEICVSGDDVKAGQDLSVEGYIRQVGGAEENLALTYLGNGPSDLSVVWPSNMYRQDFCRGYREVSHIMQASWTNDERQWIGPACEVEGVSDWADCTAR